MFSMSILHMSIYRFLNDILKCDTYAICLTAEPDRPYYCSNEHSKNMKSPRSTGQSLWLHQQLLGTSLHYPDEIIQCMSLWKRKLFWEVCIIWISVWDDHCARSGWSLYTTLLSSSFFYTSANAWWHISHHYVIFLTFWKYIYLYILVQPQIALLYSCKLLLDLRNKLY